MKKRKVLAMVLAVLLAQSCVCAFAFNETGYPICDETITVTLSAPTPGSNLDWSEYSLITELEKRLGIRLECTPYNAEAWDVVCGSWVHLLPYSLIIEVQVVNE